MRTYGERSKQVTCPWSASTSKFLPSSSALLSPRRPSGKGPLPRLCSIQMSSHRSVLVSWWSLAIVCWTWTREMTEVTQSSRKKYLWTWLDSALQTQPTQEVLLSTSAMKCTRNPCSSPSSARTSTLSLTSSTTARTQGSSIRSRARKFRSCSHLQALRVFRSFLPLKSMRLENSCTNLSSLP